jgi:hypothetical protein
MTTRDLALELLGSKPTRPNSERLGRTDAGRLASGEFA